MTDFPRVIFIDLCASERRKSDILSVEKFSLLTKIDEY